MTRVFALLIGAQEYGPQSRLPPLTGTIQQITDFYAWLRNVRGAKRDDLFVCSSPPISAGGWTAERDDIRRAATALVDCSQTRAGTCSSCFLGTDSAPSRRTRWRTCSSERTTSRATAASASVLLSFAPTWPMAWDQARTSGLWIRAGILSTSFREPYRRILVTRTTRSRFRTGCSLLRPVKPPGPKAISLRRSYRGYAGKDAQRSGSRGITG